MVLRVIRSRSLRGSVGVLLESVRGVYGLLDCRLSRRLILLSIYRRVVLFLFAFSVLFRRVMFMRVVLRVRLVRRSRLILRVV